MAKKDVDAYISAQAEPERALLKQMRQIILEVEPSLKQVISYGIPAFKLDGEVVCGIAARKSGCSFYPFSGSVLAALQTDLVKYRQTKSCLLYTSPSPRDRQKSRMPSSA